MPFVLRPTINLNLREMRSILGKVSETELVVELMIPRVQWPIVAKALTATALPIERLAVRHLGFEASTSPGRAMLGAKASHVLWAALVALKHLEMVGHSYASTLEHAGLQSLDIRGQALGKTLMKTSPDCPSLKRLSWAFSADNHGVCLSASNLKGLWSATGTPALIDLDLGSADLDTILLHSPSFLNSPLLKQLERLVVPTMDDEAAARKALPKLAHLTHIGVVNEPDACALDPRIESYTRQTAVALVNWGPGIYHVWGLQNEGVPDVADALERLNIGSIDLGFHWVNARANQLGTALAGQPQLHTVDLSNPGTYGLADGYSAFLRALRGHTALTSLNLAGNYVNDSATAFEEVLPTLPALESLEVKMGFAKAVDLEAFIGGVSNAPALRVLIAGLGPSTDVAATAWSHLRSPTLEKLRMFSTPFSAGQLETVWSGVDARLPKLADLGLGGSLSCDPSRLEAIAAAFEGRPLRRLRIQVDYKAGALRALGRLLQRVPIQELDLSLKRHRGEEPGHTELADAIRHATHLQVFGLDRAMAFDALLPLLEAVGTTPCHTVTNMRGRKIDTQEEVAAVAKAFASTRVRTYQRISYAWIPHLIERGVAEELLIKGEYWLDKFEDYLMPSLCAHSGLQRLTLQAAGILIPAAIEHPSLEQLTVTQMDPANLINLVQRLGKKGGPSKIVVGCRLTKEMQDGILQLAAAQKHPVDLTVI